MNTKIMSKEQLKKFIWDCIIDFKDKEAERKLNPVWKKLRRKGDAINHRLPGSFGG
jgi:hypothetical protein